MVIDITLHKTMRLLYMQIGTCNIGLDENFKMFHFLEGEIVMNL